MSDNKVIFINIDSYNGRSVEVKCDGQQTWHALAEEFVNFLKGMGFQVTHEDLADYFAEYKTYEEPVEDDLWPEWNDDADINFDVNYDYADSAVDAGDLNIGDITIEVKDTK